jgi:diguanylate cyclase (GGDEF)-like protein
MARTNLKKILRRISRSISVLYDLARGRDYTVLSHYILKISENNKIDDMVSAAAKCLDDILDYELFGFLLVEGSQAHVWVDPGVKADAYIHHIGSELDGQKLDFSVHNLGSEGAKTDTIEPERLLSFTVLEEGCMARLHLLPGRALLRHHQNIIQVIVRSLRIALQNCLCIRRLETAAALDPLTGCYNRRSLEQFIERDIALARRRECDLSIVMIDIDDFKAINDSFGHEAGDAVLREVSGLLTTSIRKSDYLSRYGGEEFALVLPETSLRSAVFLAEKLRAAMKELRVNVNGRSLSVTASFGVASLLERGGSAELFREADRMLYIAKSRGKDAVAPDPVTCRATRSRRSTGRYAHTWK